MTGSSDRYGGQGRDDSSMTVRSSCNNWEVGLAASEAREVGVW